MVRIPTSDGGAPRSHSRFSLSEARDRIGDAGVLRGRQARTIGSPPTIALIGDLAHGVLLLGAGNPHPAGISGPGRVVALDWPQGSLLWRTRSGAPRHDGRRCPIGWRCVGHYESFFTASAGASAAILGLLVVAVSVVNADDANPTTRELRTVLAGSAFVVLVDIFFVSIVALTGGSVVFGLSSLAMATVGLLATRRLIPRAKRAGNFSRGFRARRLNIAFASISVVGYSAQLGLAVALLANTRSAALQRALVLVLVVFYGSALGRAWEVTGITRRE